jgi:GTPase SAR1 family protein
MTVQFVDGHFVDSYYPTIENTFSKMIKWKNQDFATEIIDTAGQVREVFLRPRSRESGSPTSAQAELCSDLERNPHCPAERKALACVGVRTLLT